MATQLENALCCTKHCWGVYEQNSIEKKKEFQRLLKRDRLGQTPLDIEPPGQRPHWTESPWKEHGTSQAEENIQQQILYQDGIALIRVEWVSKEKHVVCSGNIFCGRLCNAPDERWIKQKPAVMLIPWHSPCWVLWQVANRAEAVCNSVQLRWFSL